MKLRIFPLVLALLMLFSLVACNQKKDDVTTKIYTLNGTTGFGMAKMMNDNKNSTSEQKPYEFTVKADASDVTAALINGDADIAALPTNAAANVYQKTNGGVEILAVNTLGCLYLLSTDGTTVASFEDLRGKTVYVPAQNPTFIFKYLCQENGLTVGTDIFIENQYAQPAALKDAVASGSVALAVLPEPMVTIATNAGAQNSVTVANVMDLSEEWDKISPQGVLVQGCVVVRKEFLQAHPEAVKKFLTDYKASIAYLTENLDNASQMIVDNGIFTNAGVAKKAIPNCNVTYMDGDNMKTAMKNYLSVLYSIAPASVGNALPEDDFYYSAK